MARRAVVVAVVVLLTAVAPAAGAQTVTLEAGEDLTAANGPTVELQENVSFSTDNEPDFFPTPNTVDLPNKGTVTATGPGPFVEVTDWTGGTWVAENISASGETVTIDPDDGRPIGAGGDINRIEWTDPALDDGQTDFTYAGPDGTTSTVVVYGLPGGEDVKAVASGQQLDSARTTDNGRLTLTLPNSQHSVQLQTLETDRPRLSDAEPTGEQSNAPTELAVTVDDNEFSGTDEVNVTISLDGTQVSSQKISSKTRVNTSIAKPGPGKHTWTVNATDSFGKTTVKTYQFGVPATFEIRNRSAPNSLVTTSVDVKVIQQDNSTLLTRTVSDGTLNMSGLPAGKTLTFQFTNASGYEDRTVLVRELSQNQSAYLLPSSAENVTVRFVLDDQTGEFDEGESQLLVKAPISRNGTEKYRTVVGSRFGAAGVTESLKKGVRHRLVVRNPAGDVYVPGAYTTEVNETVTVVVRTTNISRNPDTPYRWEASQANVENGNDSIVFEFSDPQNQTRDLNILISGRNNGSVVARYDFDGPVGNVTIAESVNESKEDQGFEVEWSAQRGDEDIGASTYVGTGVVILPVVSLFWRQAFSAGVLLLTGAAFSQANAGAGAVSVAVLGGLFWFLGWLSPLAAGGVVLGLAIAAVWRLRRGGVI